MKLILQTRKKLRAIFKEDTEEYYYEYEQIELETFRWNKNHTFEYVKKDSNIWSKLNENEEIVGLGL